MDVTRHLLPGTTPLLRRQPLLATRPVAGGGGGALGDGTQAKPASELLTMLGRSTTPVQLLGEADGDYVLPSGVRLRRRRFGGLRVTEAEAAQAIRGVQLLPLAHQQALARTGIVVNLLPLNHLENPPEMALTSPMIGATETSTDLTGRRYPTMIRVVTRGAQSQPGTHDSIENIVQHEIGHVFAVYAHQDLSEAPAERYAATY